MGEPVVAVAAVSRAIAEDATELVEVNYEPLPVVVDAEKSLLPGAPLLYEDWGDNVIFHDVHKSPGTEEAFETRITFSKKGSSAIDTLHPIENRAMLANFDKNQGTLSIFASTQFPHALLYLSFADSRLSENKNRVVAPKVGGGFGIKSAVFQDEVTTVILSMKLGRPVKWYKGP